MIKKIISGGETGAGQAALDAAIKWRIPHGGWIKEGRATEAGKLPEKYRLTVMSAGTPAKCAEQNIIDSNGTLIVSHGSLVKDLKYLQEKIGKHNKPCLHIDLKKINAFQAAHVVKKWASDHSIETLNVAGPKISEDKYIYQSAMRLLTTVFHMEIIESGLSGSVSPDPLFPGTIKEVIDILLDELPLRDRVQIARMKEDDLLFISPALENYIRNKFLWRGNKSLLEDCIKKSGKETIDEYEAAAILIHALWENLIKTHRIRRVK